MHHTGSLETTVCIGNFGAGRDGRVSDLLGTSALNRRALLLALSTHRLVKHIYSGSTSSETGVTAPSVGSGITVAPAGLAGRLSRRMRPRSELGRDVRSYLHIRDALDTARPGTGVGTTFTGVGLACAIASTGWRCRGRWYGQSLDEPITPLLRPLCWGEMRFLTEMSRREI